MIYVRSSIITSCRRNFIFPVSLPPSLPPPAISGITSDDDVDLIYAAALYARHFLTEPPSAKRKKKETRGFRIAINSNAKVEDATASFSLNPAIFGRSSLT